jgi:glycine hydroxymethyltransferase
MSHIHQSDPQVFEILQAEQARQQDTLNLIASENHASPAVREATGSVLADKYAEGLPMRRYYRGCENADRAEMLAIDRAKTLFGAEHCNIQPHSGSNANVAVFMAALKPGEKVLAMDLAHGGHLSHGLSINFSGRYFETHSYGVSEEDERIDMDAVADLARQHRPRLIVAGASAYPRTVDFEAFGRIAKEVGALLLADIAHIAGLVAGGVHPSPLPMADFVTSTTHKTLRGPRGALILCHPKWSKKIDSAVFPGLQGGPFMQEILAKAVALEEASQPSFRRYIRQVVANAAALGSELGERGWRLVSGGTDNHMVLVDLRSREPELNGHVASGWLDRAGIVCNKNKIPFDPRSAAQTSGLRFGTPATTTRGLKEPQMHQLAAWIDQVLASKGDEKILDRVHSQVLDLCQQFPTPGRDREAYQ